MPAIVQLVGFYDLINISGTEYMQITIYGCTLWSTAPYLKLIQLKKYRFKRQTWKNRKSRTLKIIDNGGGY